MKLTVQATVFNPDLRGEIVRIRGFDWDGDKIEFSGKITDITGDSIEAKDWNGKTYRFELESFGEAEGDLQIRLYSLSEEVLK